ncbi:MAG: chromosomal replication initiator protein DnaA [Clostridia bacterium]|nr:chromosomal replication initiator protein DnaA [Clostridia bacterium]
MEELKKIWYDAREIIRPQLAAVTFHKWIDALDPVIVQNGILVLEAADDVVKNTVTEYYLEYVRAAVQKADPDVLDVLLILPAQRRDFVRTFTEDVSLNSLTLNPKYTFDTFVVGKSNNFAHAASLAVVEAPGKAYNPLFLYGGVGLGKTHLMHAIGHAVKDANPAARIVYVTSEMFTNDMIEAVRAGKNVEFRQRYRNVDLLMIDDIQFIAGKQAVQEEFFNTFNTLHNAGKQIVISSDRPPKEIKALEERLSSRFEWGLVADIQVPDLETRTAILRNRAQNEHVEVDDEIINFIAENIVDNIRKLEGSLNRVIAYARLKRLPITLNLAKEAMREMLPQKKEIEITPDRIKETVAEYYSISLESLLSQRRDKEVVMPRQIAMYFCHTLLSLPYKRISTLFDRNDHTTAISACNKITQMLSEDKTFADTIESIRTRIKEG